MTLTLAIIALSLICISLVCSMIADYLAYERERDERRNTRRKLQ